MRFVARFCTAGSHPERDSRREERSRASIASRSLPSSRYPMSSSNTGTWMPERAAAHMSEEHPRRDLPRAVDRRHQRPIEYAGEGFPGVDGCLRLSPSPSSRTGTRPRTSSSTDRRSTAARSRRGIALPGSTSARNEISSCLLMASRWALRHCAGRSPIMSRDARDPMRC